MARLRFLAAALLALALAGSSTQTGRTAGQYDSLPQAADDRSCVIYSLSDMGYEADLGTWIAQIIPEMIEPSSWKESGGAGVLRYYAPKNILIVNHSAAVRSKVDEFLKKLKTSLPKTGRTKFAANETSSGTNVVPAEYRAPAPTRTSRPLTRPSSYPVPDPVKPPKHLFHFLIRYEGDGIIDDNVVRFMKDYAAQAMKPTNGGVSISGARSSGPIVGSSPVMYSSRGPAAYFPSTPMPGSSTYGTRLPSASPPSAESIRDAKQKENKKDKQKEKPGTVIHDKP